jgi:hypothetical protein
MLGDPASHGQDVRSRNLGAACSMQSSGMQAGSGAIGTIVTSASPVTPASQASPNFGAHGGFPGTPGLSGIGASPTYWQRQTDGPPTYNAVVQGGFSGVNAPDFSSGRNHPNQPSGGPGMAPINASDFSSGGNHPNQPSGGPGMAPINAPDSFSARGNLPNRPSGDQEMAPTNAAVQGGMSTGQAGRRIDSTANGGAYVPVTSLSPGFGFSPYSSAVNPAD